MNIHICYNKEYSKYRDFFLSNLYGCSTINVIDHILDIEGKGNFGTDTWHSCLLKRIYLYKKLFDNLPLGEIFIHSDLDIYYLQPSKLLDTYNQFYNTDLDFLGMSEYIDRDDYINGGFYMIRKNQKTKNLFDLILSYNLKDFTFGDQDVLNIVLKNSSIKYDTLDRQSYVMQCYFSDISLSKYTNIVMIHATCLESIEEKIKTINQIKYKLWWNDVL
jgi:hypothetical protein